jgi:chemotaxis protein MotB
MSEDLEQGAPQSYEERARAAAAAEGPGEEKPLPPKEPEGPDPDAWMVTFSDLLTLLMTFFVLIFASQDPVKEKIFEVFGQSAGVFGLFRTSFFEDVVAVPNVDISQDRVEVFLQEVGAVNIEVTQEERGLIITLPSNAFFRAGSAALTPEGVTRIGQLGALLQYTKHPIRVEGHTDDREARAGLTGSTWELSVERAHAVLLELQKKPIDPRRLALTGYGPSRPRFSNLSRLGRQRNRRVEIVIVNRGENP